jgi:hypothetical protein
MYVVNVMAFDIYGGRIKMEIELSKIIYQGLKQKVKQI